MKALVLGGTGRIGSAVAWDLARYGGADEVGIVGRRESSLQKTLDWIGSDRVVSHLIDISDPRESRRLMQEYDIGIIALPERRSSYRAV
ncbi:MAG: saccharopine dehydrogenase NADP-binding domain-containing protein, partial [Methanothrix sp.]